MLPLRWEALNLRGPSPSSPGLALHSSPGVSERMATLIGLGAAHHDLPALSTAQPVLWILVTSIPCFQEHGVNG